MIFNHRSYFKQCCKLNNQFGFSVEKNFNPELAKHVKRVIFSIKTNKLLHVTLLFNNFRLINSVNHLYRDYFDLK